MLTPNSVRELHRSFGEENTLGVLGVNGQPAVLLTAPDTVGARFADASPHILLWTGSYLLTGYWTTRADSGGLGWR
jgi:hypothetical protein